MNQNDFIICTRRGANVRIRKKVCARSYEIMNVESEQFKICNLPGTFRLEDTTLIQCIGCKQGKKMFKEVGK